MSDTPLQRMLLGLSSIPLTDFIFELIIYFCIHEEIEIPMLVSWLGFDVTNADRFPWRITCRRSSFRPSTDLAVRENKYSIHFLTQSSIHPSGSVRPSIRASAVTKWNFLGSRSTTLVRWLAGFPADVILTPSILGNLSWCSRVQ